MKNLEQFFVNQAFGNRLVPALHGCLVTGLCLVMGQFTLHKVMGMKRNQIIAPTVVDAYDHTICIYQMSCWVIWVIIVIFLGRLWLPISAPSCW